MQKTKGKTVIVAMSGGSDSSAAALLLKDKGFQVHGATMLIKPDSDPTRELSILHAQRICRKLGIDHKIVDLRKNFEERIISYFEHEYLRGRTPNPCILCNPLMKFTLLWQAMQGLDPDYMATGHYARLRYNPDLDEYELLKGKDEHKDQSYFLCRLNQQILARTLFPLGTMTKRQARRMLTDRGIDAYIQQESQEICFIPNNDYRAFLYSRGLGTGIDGHIVDRQGNILGRHNGLANYTIGQRKGLGISLGKPAYVVNIDHESNRIVIGSDGDLFTDGLKVRDINWITRQLPTEGTEMSVKIRYQHPGAKTILLGLDQEKAYFRFKDPQRAVTPGQAAVFYKDEKVLGGGWIM